MIYASSHRTRERTEIPGEDRLWTKGSMAVILLGGAAAAVVAFFVRKKELALGLFLGSILSIVNFYVLHALAGKILKAASHGRKTFWLWTIIRWAVAGFVLWGLVLISPSCLLGALGGYLWALAVLGWSGWRSAVSRKSSTHPLEKG